MARARKSIAYRKLERPYTRISKYKKKAFIKTATHKKIARFVAGNPAKTFPFILHLVSKTSLQIRDSAIESARQTATRHLEVNVGLSNFFLQVRKYPFHILRENPLAAGAGADRFSTGMSHSFGKPIGQAAQVQKGEPLFTVGIEARWLEEAKKALHKSRKKLPCGATILIEALATVPN
ncbi:50S ribosomal protein L16 [Candidatus Woesearchaeota archaeon]|nr:50S ribosomal protein L16 [Candidatus Woesearchaeota archaeon]